MVAWLVSSGLDELRAYRALLLDLHGGNSRFLGGDFLFAPMREMKLRKNQMILPKYEVISPNYFSFPPEESNNSSLGTEQFLRWNRRVPPLELKSSSLGTKKFQEGNYLWNSYVSEIELDTSEAECPDGEARAFTALCPGSSREPR